MSVQRWSRVLFVLSESTIANEINQCRAKGVWVNWSVSSERTVRRRAAEIRPTGPRHDRTAARQAAMATGGSVPTLSLVLTGLRESVSPLSLFLPFFLFLSSLAARFSPFALIRLFLPMKIARLDLADEAPTTARELSSPVIEIRSKIKNEFLPRSRRSYVRSQIYLWSRGKERFDSLTFLSLSLSLSLFATNLIFIAGLVVWESV